MVDAVSRGQWEQARPYIDTIPADRLASITVFGFAAQFWRATSDESQVSEYAPAVRENFAKEIADLWLALNAARFESLVALASFLGCEDVLTPEFADRVASAQKDPIRRKWMAMLSATRSRDWAKVYAVGDGILRESPGAQWIKFYRGEAAMRLGKMQLAMDDLTSAADLEKGNFRGGRAGDLLNQARALQ